MLEFGGSWAKRVSALGAPLSTLGIGHDTVSGSSGPRTLLEGGAACSCTFCPQAGVGLCLLGRALPTSAAQIQAHCSQ